MNPKAMKRRMETKHQNIWSTLMFCLASNENQTPEYSEYITVWSSVQTSHLWITSTGAGCIRLGKRHGIHFGGNLQGAARAAYIPHILITVRKFKQSLTNTNTKHKYKYNLQGACQYLEIFVAIGQICIKMIKI